MQTWSNLAIAAAEEPSRCTKCWDWARKPVRRETRRTPPKHHVGERPVKRLKLADFHWFDVITDCREERYLFASISTRFNYRGKHAQRDYHQVSPSCDNECSKVSIRWERIFYIHSRWKRQDSLVNASTSSLDHGLEMHNERLRMRSLKTYVWLPVAGIQYILDWRMCFLSDCSLIWIRYKIRIAIIVYLFL